MRDPASHRLTVGSSPLARGLLLGEVLPVPHVGIIPARAGFTATISPHEPSTSDHPRSRGVYRRINETGYAAEGSSPLARGLRRHRARPDGRQRIIPARAGFTLAGHLSVPFGGDHPRSRGVYSRYRFMVFSFLGSSPLARGLRLRDGRAGHVLGIIPARAGFTALSHSAHFPAPDHPRSRGVYGLT